MKLKAALGQYAIAVLVFLVLDLIWLTVVAERLYDHYLGDLLAESPNVGAAVIFYAIFVAGIVYFVIAEAVAKQSIKVALVRGAAFGFVTYATWDLTSLAVLEGFPSGIVPIDLAWGTFLAAAVSVGTYWIWDRIQSRKNTAA